MDCRSLAARTQQHGSIINHALHHPAEVNCIALLIRRCQGWSTDLACQGGWAPEGARHQRLAGGRRALRPLW